MKKLILTTAMFILTGMASFSQSFEKGSQAFNLGMGFVNTNYINTSYYEGFFPSVSASYEYGIAHVPMGNQMTGVISIGAYTAFSKSEYGFFENGDHYNCYDLTFAIRGNYHFIFHDKFDPYAGIWIGVNLPSQQWTGEWEEPDDIYFAHKNGPAAGAYVGARWFFTDHFAVHSEVGWLISIVNIGGTFKF